LQSIVRNGRLPERDIQSGVESLRIAQSRVRDRQSEVRFSSQILPPFMRRVPSIEALIPALYLKGISTNDFPEALAAILGPRASGLSATNIVRLKETWQKDYEAWSQRDLRGKRYVYWWADGIYFNVRLEPDRPCFLVITGALEDETKELVAVWDGHRESSASWKEIMNDLRYRGLNEGPQLELPPKNWTGGEGALKPTFLKKEAWYNARHETSSRRDDEGQSRLGGDQRRKDDRPDCGRVWDPS
jgi:putative transposase